MLSFEIVNAGRAIQVDCDTQGLDTLISILKELRDTGGHFHLRTPSNGGRELSERTPWDKEAIGEVIVTTGGD